ncbi:MAG: 1-deoxy-D-xylulose-5-phosphate reductoisomerase [Omnitrophica WOR_2 bacterium RIFCSPHIGHO2_02_FULL_48_11]|nr:MAG: 1-deoxy-D-xylulose-5-phosphate reductoisomerase [Omnitrophica WOR_2 bacterium RIFCSPHIGHO2_02_FULL_48_11]
MPRKQVVILGSTGSIGINTLKVIDRFPDRFKVVGLTAYHNIRLLEEQIRKYQPTHVAVADEGVKYFKRHASLRKIKIWDVHHDLEDLVSLPAVDVVVIGMRGSAALAPFLKAVRCGKTVAPANKEALVIAGDILMQEARKHEARIIPVDSEQSAIFQCLEGQKREQLKKIYLTASGGALNNVPQTKFDQLSVKQILDHPRWKMGKKITVDSATLMNKGFEVIEATRLFGLRVEDIEVVIHPEAIIHSMVGFKDGSILAQLGVTDMRLPIQYALTYPDRWESGLAQIDFAQLGTLTFKKPDFKKFPALALAFDVARRGGTLPAVLNAADEEAVEAFLNGQLKFSGIYRTVEKVVKNHKNTARPKLSDILSADVWAREEAKRFIYN